MEYYTYTYLSARYFIILYRYTFISRFDLRFSIIFDATAGATFTAAVTMFNAFQSVIGMMPIAHMAVGSIRQTNFQAIILYTMPHEMGLCRLYFFSFFFFALLLSANPTKMDTHGSACIHNHKVISFDLCVLYVR